MNDWIICYLIFAAGYCWGSFVTYKIMKLKQKGTRKMRKILDVLWYCAGHGNVGIVKVLSTSGEIKYYIGQCHGEDAEGDKEWIASWGSPLYPKEAGDLIFGVEE